MIRQDPNDETALLPRLCSTWILDLGDDYA